jgi:choline dehydrogenase-like flavoprotein
VCPSGARYSADRVHVPRFLASPKARLETGIALVKLELDRDGKKVATALCRRLADDAEIAIRADTVVLAQNAVETPRTLLFSADPAHHPSGLGNQGGHLGVGFSDHRMRAFFMTLPRPIGRGLAFPSANCEAFRRSEVRDKHGTFSLNFLPTPLEGDWLQDDIFDHFALQGEVLDLAGLREAIAGTYLGYTVNEIRGKGVLSLDPTERDRFGVPLPHVEIDLDPWDVAGLDRLDGVVDDLSTALGARYKSMSAQFFAAHPSGAAAMARSPDEGACDSDARVFGIDNLFVASSALFPHQGAANPTLTISALALRLAHHLGGAAG